MEKYGWKDRNSKSEYYNHCDVMIASEPSLLKVIKLLQRPMMESLRIGVSMDYAVLNQVAIAFMRREQGVLLRASGGATGRAGRGGCIEASPRRQHLRRQEEPALQQDHQREEPRYQLQVIHRRVLRCVRLRHLEIH